MRQAFHRKHYSPSRNCHIFTESHRYCRRSDRHPRCPSGAHRDTCFRSSRGLRGLLSVEVGPSEQACRGIAY
jgi:hypothetical protein